MSPFNKILNSSTAWLGAIATGLSASGIPIPAWLLAAVVGAYGIKEAGSKVADALKNPPKPPATPPVGGGL